MSCPSTSCDSGRQGHWLHRCFVSDFVSVVIAGGYVASECQRHCRFLGVTSVVMVPGNYFIEYYNQLQAESKDFKVANQIATTTVIN